VNQPARPAGPPAPVGDQNTPQVDPASGLPSALDANEPAPLAGQGVAANVAGGAVKAVAQDMRGMTALANKVLPSGMQIPDATKGSDIETHGAAQTVGAMGENAVEWAMGEESLKAIQEFATAAKFLKTPGMLTAYLKSSPKVAKALEAVAHGITLGGAQGAVHGAAEGDATKGAVLGAAGGAAGAGLAEGISAGLPKLAKILGLGGLTMEENMTKAAGGSLNVGTQNWQQSLQKAMPLLAQEAKTTAVKTVGDFEDLAYDTADKLWKTQIQPQIDRHITDPIDTTSIRNEIQGTVTRSMKKYFPEEAKKIEEFAGNFGKPTTIGEVAEDLQTFNAKLKAYYKAPPEARAAILKTEGDVTALEQAADSMRDALNKALESKGEKIPAELRQQYGALKEVQRVFGKRAIVADRQMPLNIQQVLAMIGGAGEAAAAIGAGHPGYAIAGAVPIAVASAAKIRNAPANLIKQGLKQAGAAAPSAAISTAKGAAKSGTAFLGSQAGQGWVKFTGKDGKSYLIHKDDLQTAQDRGLIKKEE
jgi:hypothetical protein